MKKMILLSLFLWGGTLLTSLFMLTGCWDATTKVIFSRLNVDVAGWPAINGPEIAEENDTCRYRNYVQQVSVAYEIVNKIVYLPSGNSCYAFQFKQNVKSIEKVKDIRVITLYDYNASIQSGDEVSQRCLLQPGSYSGFAGSFISKDSLIASFNQTGDEYEASYYFSFKINEPPAIASIQQFVVELRTEEGAVLRDTTVAYVLIP